MLCARKKSVRLRRPPAARVSELGCLQERLGRDCSSLTPARFPMRFRNRASRSSGRSPTGITSRPLIHGERRLPDDRRRSRHGRLSQDQREVADRAGTRLVPRGHSDGKSGHDVQAVAGDLLRGAPARVSKLSRLKRREGMMSAFGALVRRGTPYLKEV